ncbi:SDR family oxidoreductase [Actinomycetospora sp.]|jgi:NAD(P)-dependent dehydrogenase (short-subunit alcohol dehydrogenase family)|uniref:SDR family oxidoreductase n=1 Tax=Actinomycetospora sp. TaxID=1872135 RepID=UPI002F410622
MRIAGSTALVTGAGRGLGATLVEALLARGAATVYAGARDPRSVIHQDPRVVPLRLDVTDPASVRDVAERAGDVDLLINNAGIAGNGSLLTGDPERARAEVETNFWGPVTVLRAFAPVLARNGGGAAVNVLSVLSWLTAPATGSYSASKAAAWSFTGSARAELRGQGTQVVGVHLGYMDTDMVAALDVPKIAPADVARQALDAIEDGTEEVLADLPSERAKVALSGAPAGLEL